MKLSRIPGHLARTGRKSLRKHEKRHKIIVPAAEGIVGGSALLGVADGFASGIPFTQAAETPLKYIPGGKWLYVNVVHKIGSAANEVTHAVRNLFKR
jgi:hypothetical protein